jgi:hypothetical protein
MIRRRKATRTFQTSSLTRRPAFTDFHEWVLSLPWVVERPPSFGTPGVRTFGVDCEPLNRRQLWLITGLHKPSEADAVALAVIIPDEAADAIEDAGWAYRWAPMRAGHVLMRASDASAHRPHEIEALAIAAYSCAMA